MIYSCVLLTEPRGFGLMNRFRVLRWVDFLPLSAVTVQLLLCFISKECEVLDRSDFLVL